MANSANNGSLTIHQIGSFEHVFERWVSGVTQRDLAHEMGVSRHLITLTIRVAIGLNLSGCEHCRRGKFKIGKRHPYVNARDYRLHRDSLTSRAAERWSVWDASDPKTKGHRVFYGTMERCVEWLEERCGTGCVIEHAEIVERIRERFETRLQNGTLDPVLSILSNPADVQGTGRILDGFIANAKSTCIHGFIRNLACADDPRQETKTDDDPWWL